MSAAMSPPTPLAPVYDRDALRLDEKARRQLESEGRRPMLQGRCRRNP